MVVSGQIPGQPPLEVEYAPQRRHRLLPVEVLDRSEVLARISTRELANRQRSGFHQLVVCTGGQAIHDVDFETVELSRGTLLRIHPGQVQQFEIGADAEATMVVWPIESHHADPTAPAWYPGDGSPTFWNVDDVLLTRVLGWIEELRVEQARFEGDPRQIGLMQALLCSLLLRLAIEIPESTPTASNLPRPYLEFRELIEERIYQRPTVVELARHLGYSSRTLDRACQQAVGQTAKQVLDERVALEVRRLLTHTTRPITQIGTDFGFSDPSNFSKFVKRHLGRLPGYLRAGRDGSEVG